MRLFRSILRYVSFLLSLVFMTLWLRSCAEDDLIVKTTASGRHFEIVTIPGSIRFTIAENWLIPGIDLIEPWNWQTGTHADRYPIYGHSDGRRRWYYFVVSPFHGRRTISNPF